MGRIFTRGLVTCVSPCYDLLHLIGLVNINHHESTHPSSYPPTHPTTHPSNPTLPASVHPSIHPSIQPSIHPSSHPAIQPAKEENCWPLGHSRFSSEDSVTSAVTEHTHPMKIIQRTPRRPMKGSQSIQRAFLRHRVYLPLTPRTLRLDFFFFFVDIKTVVL